MMISHWRFVTCCSLAMIVMVMMPILRVSAFAPSSILANHKNTMRSMRSSSKHQERWDAAASTPRRGLYMAGFGAATPSPSSSSSSSSGADSGGKLKAKTQWDRFLDLKQEATSYIVGVKIVADVGNDSDWLVVGQVRCRDESLLAAAVARQRGLLADHAKRLFPLKVTPQVKLAWGYFQADSGSTTTTAAPTVAAGTTRLMATGSWVVIDPKTADSRNSSKETKDFDKSIGYEGTPDPSTGYYCSYNEGRLVGNNIMSTTSANTPNAAEPPMAAKKSIRPSSKSK
jgi:hypothetical protein